MKPSIMLISLLLAGVQSAYGADWIELTPYFDLGYESGGFELAKVDDPNLSSDSNAGGGIRLTVGGQLVIVDRHRLTLGVGIITERLDDLRFKSGGFDSKTVTAIYEFWLNEANDISIGIGTIRHLDPRFNCGARFDSCAINDLRFEDSDGLLLQVQFPFVLGFALAQYINVGLRYTEMEYSTGERRFDGNSISLFMTVPFHRMPYSSKR